MLCYFNKKLIKNNLQQICLISSHQQKKSHCNSLPQNLWNTSRATFRFSSIFSIVIVNINGNGQILIPLSKAAALRQPNLCPSLATALGKNRDGCIEVEDAELYPNVLHRSPQPHKQPEAAAGAQAHSLGNEAVLSVGLRGGASVSLANISTPIWPYFMSTQKTENLDTDLDPIISKCCTKQGKMRYSTWIVCQRSQNSGASSYLHKFCPVAVAWLCVYPQVPFLMVFCNFLIQKARQSPRNSGKLTGVGMHNATVGPVEMRGAGEWDFHHGRWHPPTPKSPAPLLKPQLGL